MISPSNDRNSEPTLEQSRAMDPNLRDVTEVARKTTQPVGARKTIIGSMGKIFMVSRAEKYVGLLRPPYW